MRIQIYPKALKPCPFCGEADERNLKVQTPRCDDGRHYDAYIRCFSCLASGPVTSINHSSEEIGSLQLLPLIDVWNRRGG